MTPKPRLAPFVLACALGGAGVVQQVHLQGAAPVPRNSATLDLRLAAWEGLTPLTRRTLATEAKAIWQRSDVQLRWLSGTETRSSEQPLRVLITLDSVGAKGDSARWPVGELLRFDDAAAIVVASIAGAQRVAAESALPRIFDVPEHQEHRLGLILGRAVAHEIGHFLLRTDTHAPEGLMRATIDAREFAGLHATSFDLDVAAKAHLAALAVAPPTGRGPAPFSYTR